MARPTNSADVKSVLHWYMELFDHCVEKYGRDYGKSKPGEIREVRN